MERDGGKNITSEKVIESPKRCVVEFLLINPSLGLPRYATRQGECPFYRILDYFPMVLSRPR
jgi:hypothetical protein